MDSNSHQREEFLDPNPPNQIHHSHPHSPHSPQFDPSTGTMTDLLAQQESNGIYYEPYHNDFRLCIYEEPNVQGRNERYEFRCDSHLSCCGRVCGDCPVEAFPFPLWLLLLLLFLALLLLLALLYLLYRLCCRKKRGEKEVVKKSTTTRRRTTRPYYGDEAGYRSIERDDDRERLFRDRASYTEMPNGHAKVEERIVEQRSPFRRSFHEEETFEEEFHEEIEVEQGGKVAEVSSLDSRRI